jgi:hypothetical protein
MRVRISARTGSYAIYVLRGDDDAFVERALRVFAKYDARWVQEVYDGRYRKIIVLRHVVV